MYAAGIKAQKVSNLKRLLREQCGVFLRNIPHIDFIGKSVTEFHLFSDYADTFKRKLEGACKTIHFIDVDPLEPTLLRKTELEGNTTMAATKYLNRLERRFSTSPSSVHKDFLGEEINRAKQVLSSAHIE